MMKTQVTLLSLLLLASPLRAEIYKWADNNGTIHFSDKPRAGAEKVTLPPTQTFSPEKKPDIATPAPEVTQPVPTLYTNLSIVQPQDQETIWSNPGLLSVITRVEPELQKGDKLQLIFDGAPIGSPQTELVFALNNVNRGSHTLVLNVLNEQGEVIESTQPITIFMHQTRVGGGG